MNTRERQIELAKKLIATGISQEAKEVLEKQFPELVEKVDSSEIEDYILELVSNLSHKNFKKYKKEEVLSYLKNRDLKKIHGWVARDEGEDGELCFFLAKPIRVNEDGDRGWWCNDSDCPEELKDFLKLDDSMFPDLTWVSEPLEVEMVIKKK